MDDLLSTIGSPYSESVFSSGNRALPMNFLEDLLRLAGGTEAETEAETESAEDWSE